MAVVCVEVTTILNRIQKKVLYSTRMFESMFVRELIEGSLSNRVQMNKIKFT